MVVAGYVWLLARDVNTARWICAKLPSLLYACADD